MCHFQAISETIPLIPAEEVRQWKNLFNISALDKQQVLDQCKEVHGPGSRAAR